jgi:hypothetical protein
MSETAHAGGRSFMAQIEVESGPGRGRSTVGWFIVGDQGLTVRPWPRWMIPERSASKDAVGDICVDRILHVYFPFPIIRWHHRETVRFENPECPLAGLLIEVRRRARIVDELRAREYLVVDRRTQ